MPNTPCERSAALPATEWVKCHRACFKVYVSGVLAPVRHWGHSFTEIRSGKHTRTFIGQGTTCAWREAFLCVNQAGYTPLLAAEVDTASWPRCAISSSRIRTIKG
jgi:hypothetical protein